MGLTSGLLPVCVWTAWMSAALVRAEAAVPEASHVPCRAGLLGGPPVTRPASFEV